MTTMGIQNQDFDYSHSFLKTQSKRVLYGCQPTKSHKASRGQTSNTKSQHQTASNTTSQTRKYSKAGQTCNTNTTTASRKSASSHYSNKEERYSVNISTQNFYAKPMLEKNSFNNKTQKNAYASTASDSDGNGAYTQSELYGFRIVQSGRVIHDEIEEDGDLFESDNEWTMGSTFSDKFAASVLTIGPNAKEISLPSFA